MQALLKQLGEEREFSRGLRETNDGTGSEVPLSARGSQKKYIINGEIFYDKEAVKKIEE